MVAKFIGRYFPLSKVANMMQDVSAFGQKDSETLFKAYGRFKDILRRCPHHRFAPLMRVQILYNGLNYQTHQLIDARSGGFLSNKYPEEAQ